MDLLREDEEIDSWESTTIVPETTVASTFVMFDSDLPTLNQTVLDNGTTVTNHTVQIWTNWIGNLYRNAQQSPVWSGSHRWIERTTQSVQDAAAGLDPLAIGLIVLAIVIALAGLLAIFCQCCLWRRAKRKHQQRTFDTTSWFEYAFDREKFAHLDHNGNDITQPNLEQKKENLQNFYNDISAAKKQRTKNSSAMNSTLKSQSEFSAIDIENCQLVKSFMRHDSDTNSGKDSKRVLIKKPSKSSLSKVEKKKMMKEKKQRMNDCKVINKSMCVAAPNRYFVPYGSQMFIHQSMPILHPSTIFASVSPKKKKRSTDEHNDLLLRSCSSSTASMPRPKVHTNESSYETQTCALNLSYDSADTDLSADPTIIEVDNAPIKSVSSTVTKAPKFSSKTAVTAGPQSSASLTLRKASIERTVKCRQQVPDSSAQTKTRSFNTKGSTLTAITGASSSSVASSVASTNRHFASLSAISKNPLYREFSNDSDTTARVFNHKRTADSTVSSVTISSCSTFTRPPKPTTTSVSHGANKV